MVDVDCTGSYSAGLRWLKELATREGNEAAVQQLNNLRLTYNPKQSYYTCTFDVPFQVIPRLAREFPADWDSTGTVFANFPDAKMDNKILAVSRKENNYRQY